MSQDPMGPARGIINGMLIAIPIWIAVIAFAAGRWSLAIGAVATMAAVIVLVGGRR